METERNDTRECSGAAAAPVVIVTGGSRGIGRSIVEHLHADGFAVVFTHSSSDAEARELVARLSSDRLPVRVDVVAEGVAGRVVTSHGQLQLRRT